MRPVALVNCSTDMYVLTIRPFLYPFQRPRISRVASTMLCSPSSWKLFQTVSTNETFEKATLEGQIHSSALLVVGTELHLTINVKYKNMAKDVHWPIRCMQTMLQRRSKQDLLVTLLESWGIFFPWNKT
jgi:hypothetical protein